MCWKVVLIVCICESEREFGYMGTRTKGLKERLAGEQRVG